MQAAGYYSREFDAADGTPIVPGWDATPVPDDIVLLDAPEFDRLPKGPPRPALLAELIRRSPEGVVVLAIRPSDPEPPGDHLGAAAVHGRALPTSRSRRRRSSACPAAAWPPARAG